MPICSDDLIGCGSTKFIADESEWSWRYVEFGNRRMFFNAHFDASSGRLKHTSRTPEPELLPRFGFGARFWL